MMNKVLYTVSHYKVFTEEKARLEDVWFAGEKMEAIFCENEKGVFVIICKYRKTAPYRACGHWHSGKSLYDVYFRKNFTTRKDGNDFYLAIKQSNTVG